MNIYCCKCRKVIGRPRTRSQQLQVTLQEIAIECPACASGDSSELVTKEMLDERLKLLEENFITELSIKVHGLYNTISKKFKDQ